MATFANKMNSKTNEKEEKISERQNQSLKVTIKSELWELNIVQKNQFNLLSLTRHGNEWILLSGHYFLPFQMHFEERENFCGPNMLISLEFERLFLMSTIDTSNISLLNCKIKKRHFALWISTQQTWPYQARVSNITQPKVSIILDYLSMAVLLGLVPSEAMIHSIAKLAPKIVGTIL